MPDKAWQRIRLAAFNTGTAAAEVRLLLLARPPAAAWQWQRLDRYVHAAGMLGCDCWRSSAERRGIRQTWQGRCA